jgi:nicotinamidase-related amidase
VTDRAAEFARLLRLEPGRTALLVVDMQRGFVDAGQAMEVPPAREIVPAIRALLDGFQAKRLPVVFTEFTYSPAVPILVGELHPEHRPAPPGAPRGSGVPSSSCLEGDASEYRISVVADGVATLWPEIQRATLDIVGRAFGRVVQSKEVLDTISSW